MLINGWRLVVDLSQVAIFGVLFSRDFETAYYTTALIGQKPATVSSLVNTVIVTETTNVITGDLAATDAAIAAVQTTVDDTSAAVTTVQSTVDTLPDDTAQAVWHEIDI